jgi:hypothetical protein
MDEILKLPQPQRPRLCEADLSHADLAGANLGGADLAGVHLEQANLSGAHLDQADLTEAFLSGADLSRAHLLGAHLAGASLVQTNLAGADLDAADLAGAVLIGANLAGARLAWADLTGAYLSGADLAGALLLEAKLASVRFQPKPESLNSVRGVEFASGLDRLRFENSPTALIVLRERFAKAGLRDQERQVTYAKLRSQQVNEWERGTWRQRVEAGFSYFAFDLTCRYGLDYGRPLRVLGALIPVLALVYAFALRGRGRGAIWRLWKADRILEDEGQTKPERLSWEAPKGPQGIPRGFAFRLCRALSLGLFFSLLSAFQIGWRDLNVGNWITRLLPSEYTLQATGWVRVVSGAQSLLSVYLVALWALTYFGRPFE